jgi:hypothetical protein
VKAHGVQLGKSDQFFGHEFALRSVEGGTHGRLQYRVHEDRVFEGIRRRWHIDDAYIVGARRNRQSQQQARQALTPNPHRETPA